MKKTLLGLIALATLGLGGCAVQLKTVCAACAAGIQQLAAKPAPQPPMALGRPHR